MEAVSTLAACLNQSVTDFHIQSTKHDCFSHRKLLHILLEDHIFFLVFSLTVCLLLVYWITVPINVLRDWSIPAQDNCPRSHPIPPVYPNGWLPIAESRDVVSNAVFRAKVHVKQVIILRNPDGGVAVYDAYCPHLGADLGVGGELATVDNVHCIKCPFHGWLFDSRNGSCVRVPYAKDMKGPSGVRLTQWMTREINGFVCVWHHAEGKEPDWFPISTPEVQAREWTYGGRTENVVNCHLQEIPENGADVGHLNAIHSPSLVWGKFFGSWTRSQLANFVFGIHEWSAEWNADPDFKHLAHIKIQQNFAVFGFTIITLKIKVQQFRIRGLLSQAVISVASNKQRVIHHVYTKQSLMGRLFSRLMLFGEANMVDRDCIMWQNKKFLKNPALVKEEKSVARFRHWYQQFYSENSPKTFSSPLEW